MPDLKIKYGTRTQFSGVANLVNLASNAAKPMGAVDNSSLRAVGFLIDYKITPGASAGEAEFYLIESHDGGTTWTDGISPSGSSDVASSLRAAEAVHSAPVASSTDVKDGFVLPVEHVAKHWSLVPKNDTGANFGGSGSDMHYTPIFYEAV